MYKSSKCKPPQKTNIFKGFDFRNFIRYGRTDRQISIQIQTDETRQAMTKLDLSKKDRLVVFYDMLAKMQCVNSRTHREFIKVHVINKTFFPVNLNRKK